MSTSPGSGTPPSRGRVGRPRAQGRAEDGLSAREGVLAAAAELFTRQGYASTTTRAIAEGAGLRQASMYHYFGGKEDILAALLEGTVRPSLDLARQLLLLAPDETAETRLWALCRADVELLCGGPHNLGALYLLPETGASRFADFRRLRDELRAAYAALFAATKAGQALPEAERELRADLLFGLIEGVILIRRQAAEHTPLTLPEAAADSALRLAGTTERRLADASARGAALLRELRRPQEL
ncbi:AcrR family transcriptional regulator [Streptacidiphilus sp. MAP12-20]|uniref:TetR/AcrR family transcriptional regulator n=1 Tax=Streptacidiphilus sp. MAP12-20 TaxID=3156299 RepID=UPI0035134428